MEELRQAGEARAAELEEHLSGSGAEVERLRGRLEEAGAEAQAVREQLERTEHDRAKTAAKLERLGYEMQELARDAEARRRAQADEMTRIAEQADERRRDDEARMLELEHELELAAQSRTELESEIERLGGTRDELAASIDRLVEEGEQLRQVAAQQERSLRDEIGSLEDRNAALAREAEARSERFEETSVELRREIDERRQEIDELRVELERSAAGADRLEHELAAAADRERGLEAEIEALRGEVGAVGERSAALEAELGEANAAVERIEAENRELDAMRRSLIGNQERLEKKLDRATKKLSALPSAPAGSAGPSQPVRRGALRAAALVGFGLILGFIASYPFETLLVSADPMAIPTSRPALEAAAPRAASPVVADDPKAEPAAEPVAPDPSTAESTAEQSAPPPAIVRPSPLPAVERWARAWSEQRVADYLDAYASTFEVPDGFTRSGWESYRAERVESPDSIQVTIDAFETLETSAEAATVRFEQSYVAGAYRDRVSKTLELVWEADDWRIRSETSVPLG